jgi:hypothetical protein
MAFALMPDSKLHGVSAIRKVAHSVGPTGFTHVTVVPIMTAEEADKAVAKVKTLQSPHQER